MGKVSELSSDALAKQSAWRAERHLASKDYRGNEAARVSELIRNSKSYDRSDKARRQAEIAIANGHDADAELAVLGPTDEQLSKADYDPIEAMRTSGWQGRTIMTVRRRDVPVAHKMLMKGIINSEQFSACAWYRNAWEASGMTGNISSTDYTKEVFAAASARSQLTDSQMEIADCLRFVVGQMTARHGRLIFATVVEDTPINKAVRIARAFHRFPIEGFREAVVQLVDAKKNYEKG